MMLLRSLCFLIFLNFAVSIFAIEIPITYHLMDRKEFETWIVDRVVIGVTRQSQSLYMLHFFANGKCELCKQNKTYAGHWWIEQDQDGQDYVRAFWPLYTSVEPNSLFSPQNPNYGKATKVRYFCDQEHHFFFITGKNFQSSIIVVSPS